MSWRTLGATPPRELVDARLQLHQAAQVVASAGVTFLVPEPDDSHPNLEWVDSLDSLVGRILPGVDVQIGLRLSDLSLLLVERGSDVSDEFALDGRTLDDGYAWLATSTARAGAELPASATRAVPNFLFPNDVRMILLPGLKRSNSCKKRCNGCTTRQRWETERIFADRGPWVGGDSQ